MQVLEGQILYKKRNVDRIEIEWRVLEGQAFSMQYKSIKQVDIIEIE